MAEGSAVPTKVQRVKEFLRDAAVSDADHDFQGTRAGSNIFSRIFQTYKSIGTPVEPVNKYDEWTILYKMLNLNLESKDPINEFIQRFCPSGDPGPRERYTFQRWKEDAVPYIVSSVNLGKKEDGKYMWNPALKPSDLYDFLKSKNQTNFVFTVDACNCPFYDFLQEVEPASKNHNKKAICIHTRESINDAAGKKEFKNIDAKDIIQFDNLYDEATYNTLYPITDIKLSLIHI